MEILKREAELRRRNEAIETRKNVQGEVDAESGLDPEGRRALKAAQKFESTVMKQKLKQLASGPADLHPCLDAERKERLRLMEELRCLQQDQEQLRMQVSKAAKREQKLIEEVDTVKRQLAEAQRELAAQKQHQDRLEREQKQRETSARSDTLRLNRQEEQISKLRAEEKVAKDQAKELKEELHKVRDDSLKQMYLKEKQIEQLVHGFQKQMQLIDVLRRQKLHLEAAHVLKYSQDEFLQTLDWAGQH